MESCRMMRATIWQKTALAMILAAVFIWTACGDVFRPVAVPLPGPNPDPKNYHFAMVLSQNAVGNPGSAMQIDVSGDTNVGVVAAGQTPVHAMLLPPNASRVYVANGASDNVSVFAPGTIFSFPSAVTTISFPTGSNPVFLHTTEGSTVYAADFGSSDVAVISASANVITQLIPVGPNPNLLAETPDTSKLYVLNSGNHTITSINPVNKTVNGTFAVPGVSSPVWMDASLDSSQLFILDSANGVITSLNTQTDSVASTSSAAGAGANFMSLDRHLNRLYVTNPSNNTLSIFNAGVANASSATPPALLKTIALPTPPSSVPMMVTALNDGTKVYVLSYQPTTSAEVTVIRTSDNSIVGQPIQLMNTAVVPAAAQSVCSAARFRASMTSSVDSSRVYVSLCDPGTTNIINTSTDSVVLPMDSPLSAYPAQMPPTPPSPPPQNPVWVVAGP
jgi:DNA-binding beta-propeller fold protein YncE